MKEWYKALAPDHPAVKDVVNALSWEGYGFMCRLMQLYHEIGEVEIDVEMLCRNFGINKRKAARIYPVLMAGFAKVLKSFGKDCKVLESFAKDSETLESFGKLDHQNPHGSTRDQEENRGEEREGKKKKPTNKTGLPEDFKISDPITKWAKENKFTEWNLNSEKPKFLEYHEKLGSKFSSWEAAFKTWMRNARDWDKLDPEPKTSKQQSLVDALLSGVAIVNRFDENHIIPVEEIVRDQFDQLTWNGRHIEKSEFESVGAV